MPLSDADKFAVYTDELDPDPTIAIPAARQLGFDYVVLRQLWSTNAGAAPDAACQRVVGLLKRSLLQVAMVATEIGRQPADQLVVPDAAAQRAILIAAYFRAPLVRFFAGAAVRNSKAAGQVQDWMNWVAGEARRAGVIPGLEISPDALVAEPDDVAGLLAANPTWQLIYDPAMLLIKRRQEPWTRYGPPLIDKMAAVDLHDLRIGSSYVPAGQGDAQWPLAVQDLRQVGYNGWWLVEHSLGKHWGNNRVECTKHAWAAIQSLPW